VQPASRKASAIFFVLMMIAGYPELAALLEQHFIEVLSAVDVTSCQRASQ
jgi:hypothetical protein